MYIRIVRQSWYQKHVEKRLPGISNGAIPKNTTQIFLGPDAVCLRAIRLSGVDSAPLGPRVSPLSLAALLAYAVEHLAVDARQPLVDVDAVLGAHRPRIAGRQTAPHARGPQQFVPQPAPGQPHHQASRPRRPCPRRAHPLREHYVARLELHAELGSEHGNDVDGVLAALLGQLPDVEVGQQRVLVALGQLALQPRHAFPQLVDLPPARRRRRLHCRPLLHGRQSALHVVHPHGHIAKNGPNLSPELPLLGYVLGQLRRHHPGRRSLGRPLDQGFRGGRRHDLLAATGGFHRGAAIVGAPGPLLKLWRVLSKYVLTLPFFVLFLHGALLMVVLLDTNVTELLKREAAMGHVPGNTHDWVTIGAALVEFGFGAVIAWWGQARKHLALSFWLTAAAAAGLLVLAFPYEDTSDSSLELCGGEQISTLRAESTLINDPWVPRLAMLCMTAAFCVLARLSIFAHGFVYVDDHEPENGPYLYGILITIRLSLGLNGVSWLTGPCTTDTWWHAHLSLCMLTLMFGIIYMLFPARMGNHKEVDDEMASKDFLSTVSRVLRDRTVVVQSIALSFLSAAVFGFVRFDDDFVQAQFHIETKRQDPRASRAATDIFRSLVIIFFVLIFRTRFSGRRSDGVKATTSARVGGVVALVLTVPFVVVSLLGCGIGNIAGSNADAVQPVCSMHCGCLAESYGFSPVCALNTTTTYFSPCHAGCSSYDDLNGFLLYEECSCGGGRAARGACSLPNCGFAFNVYQLLFALALSLAGAALLMQGMAVVRSVLSQDKAVAIGASFAATALFSHIPGYMLYMVASYYTCAYSANSGCLLHHPSLWSMAALSAVFSALSGALSLVASRLARGPVPPRPC